MKLELSVVLGLVIGLVCVVPVSAAQKVKYENGIRLQVWTGHTAPQTWTPEYIKSGAVGGMIAKNQLFTQDIILSSNYLRNYHGMKTTFGWNALLLIKQDGEHVFSVINVNPGSPTDAVIFFNDTECFRGLHGTKSFSLQLKRGFYNFTAISHSGEEWGVFRILMKEPGSDEPRELTYRDFYVPAKR